MNPPNFSAIFAVKRQRLLLVLFSSSASLALASSSVRARQQFGMK